MNSPPGDAVGRGADNIQRQAGLLSQQARHKIEEEVADQGGEHHAQQGRPHALRKNSRRAVSLSAAGAISCQNTNQSMMPA